LNDSDFRLSEAPPSYKNTHSRYAHSDFSACSQMRSRIIFVI
jgi:hypothetical protein